MMRKTPYQKLMDRKRKWSPVKPTAGVFKDGSEDAIRRALAIRHMELPVGEFISEALTKEVPDHARELLLSNVKDEERHDLALGYIVDAHGIKEDSQSEVEAKRIRDAWLAHPDHTITKALVAERAIFFVSPGTSRSMSERILLYVLSWAYLLLLLWINLGRPPLTGFFNL